MVYFDCIAQCFDGSENITVRDKVMGCNGEFCQRDSRAVLQRIAAAQRESIPVLYRGSEFPFRLTFASAAT